MAHEYYTRHVENSHDALLVPTSLPGQNGANTK